MTEPESKKEKTAESWVYVLIGLVIGTLIGQGVSSFSVGFGVMIFSSIVIELLDQIAVALKNKP